MFSYDTDMNKLEKELVEINSPVKRKPYRHSLYDDNANRNVRFGRRVSNLEASAENESGWDAVEGNPFQDAPADPDYMPRHWVPRKGCSLIPKEEVEYFKSAEEEDMSQGDDAFMKKLKFDETDCNFDAKPECGSHLLLCNRYR